MPDPTPEDVRELVSAAEALRGLCHVDRCPYCGGEGEEHLVGCLVLELTKKLFPFRDRDDELIEVGEDYCDIRELVLVAREIADALDGWDPDFHIFLRSKLVPFEAIH
jgi:hypothetical protein